VAGGEGGGGGTKLNTFTSENRINGARVTAMKEKEVRMGASRGRRK